MDDERLCVTISGENVEKLHGGSSSSTPSPLSSSVPLGLSSILPALTGPPPAVSIPPRFPPQERLWSNAAIKFLLAQCKEHVEAHNSISMRQHQWVRIHELLLAQFPQESGRKVKSLSDKWEKLRSTYNKIKKARNATGGGTVDDIAKFPWYDDIDEILSLTAKANGIPRGMDQGVPIPGTGTSQTPVDLIEEDEGGDHVSPPRSPPHVVPSTSIGSGPESSGSSPRTRAANLMGCRGKSTSSKPAGKRAKVDRSLMQTLDKLADSTAEIEKLRIEAALTMQKENREFELKLFELQQASAQQMASFFADALKKTSKDNP